MAQVLLVRLLVGRLMLGDRVDERVACASVLHKEAAHARRRRPKVVHRELQIRRARDSEDEDGHSDLDAEQRELQEGEALVAALPLAVLEDLEGNEDEQWPDLLRRLERAPTDDGYAHGAHRTDDEEERVRAMQLRCEASKEEEDNGVRADQVDDEDEAAPRGHHAHVREPRHHAPHDRVARSAPVGGRWVVAQRADPAEDGGGHACERDRLVVVPATNGTHQVRGHDRHDPRSDHARGVRA